MVETLHLSLYTIVKIIKKDDVKNKVPIRCFKQYALYDAHYSYIDIQITWEFVFK